MTHPPSVDLPPMPKGSTFKITFKEAAQVGQTVTTPMHYTADNMRAYAQLAVNEALERAAKLCDENAQEWYGPHAKDMSAHGAASRCADDVRALKGKT